ncbi:hypothetical protein CRM22_000611 [Opisthorchis felineus]|uniref:Protein asunder n=1 Tax=Opisthorchis felineus TaxID=147828 RepID=A0A4S2MKF0_OPIFE|nr:hypothetical protein CRM22_000611 [Opisthorchis felineus]TGZ75038.1 hypothetical protein CRM22_000611 [Opisthorchis felineus]
MDFNEKTVFVLNHTQHFSQPSRDEILLESGTKTTTSTKAIFRKSLWTNTVDAVIQYCRVVFDLFSHEKPISIITFDSEEKIHSVWLEEDQNIETLWSVFTHEGPPKETTLDLKNCAVMPGLETACSMLQMLKPSQKVGQVAENTGRVVIISASMRSQITSWIPDILNSLNAPVNMAGNASVSASEWLFVDLVADPEANYEAPQPIEPPPGVTGSSTHRFFYHQLPSNGTDLYRGLMRLVESHYHLASTLVQDIPMKEEANTSSSSTMYGVELLHLAEVHDLLHRAGLADRLFVRSDTTEQETVSTLQRPNSGFSKTLGIKWVTPKSADAALLRYAISAHRVTLADVGNRASTCLAQFVLGGRSVALAHRLPVNFPSLPAPLNATSLAPSTNEALLLTCHGSVMYLHALATICPLAHPVHNPPLSSHTPPSGLRVQSFTDQVIRPSRLAPASAHQKFTVAPRERAQQHLERSTRYWPVVDSETLFGSNKLSLPLYEHLPKEYLEPSESAACTRAIDKLVNAIKDNVSLTDTRKGALKRSAAPLPVAPSVQAEAIALALEVDHLLSVYSNISCDHKEIQRYWKDAIGVSKPSSDSKESSLALTGADSFSALELHEMVTIARLIATGQSTSCVDNVPDSLVKTVRSLRTLCDSLNSATNSNTTTSRSSGNRSDKRLKTEASQFASEESLILEPVNLNTFLDLLQPMKQKQCGATKRPEFAGVATADAKGLCQLYRALREKEKE